MDNPDARDCGQLQITGDLAVFAPEGKVTLQQGVELIRAAIARAVKQESPYLLINILGLHGYGMPSLGERYFMSHAWASEANGKIVLAVVVPAEKIDPEKFGSKVIKTLGTMNDIFPTLPQALEWLRDQGCTGAGRK